MDWTRKHLNLNEITEFESLITIEPMEIHKVNQDPLDLTFEEYETSQTSDSVHVFPNEPRGVLKKKPRFADPIIIETEADKQDVIDKVKSFINEDELVEQMDSISVEEYSEKLTDLESQEISSINEQDSRLDQLSSRIFATILPDNVSMEQSKQDVKQAYKRLNMITNGAQVLVFNCSQNNIRLDRIFHKVQNCAFSLTSYPNLATMVLFCQKVYDWLALDEYHIILFHAEGEQAKIRLMLFALALDSFYGSINKYRNEKANSLRRYITSHSNGFSQVPVGWMRYAGYMQLFSPIHSLTILRAALHIYQVHLCNFPVFEMNQLRIYFKFYTGSPPVHMYTTNIYEFKRINSTNLVLNFQSNSDRNIGLQLSGDIIILAYHSRSYPLKRIRLFRLHIHSCQGIEDWIRFTPNDFDEISEYKIHTVIENITKQKTSLNNHHSVNLFNVQSNPEDRSRLHDSLENLSEPMKSRQLPLRLAPCLNKQNSYDYLIHNAKLDSNKSADKFSHLDNSRIIHHHDVSYNEQEVNKGYWDPRLTTSINHRINSRVYKFLDAGLDNVHEEFDNVIDQHEEDNDCVDGDYHRHHNNNSEIKTSQNDHSQSETNSFELNNINNYNDSNHTTQQNHHKSGSSSSSLSFKILDPKYLFQSKKLKHKNSECVNDVEDIDKTKQRSEKKFNQHESMPPPSSTTVLKYSKKHKTIGRRIANFFSAHSKHRKMDNNSSASSSIHSSDSPSNDRNPLDDDDESSELSLGQQSSGEISTNHKRINQKTHAWSRGIPTDKLGPPCKTRKLISVGTSPTHWSEPVQTFYPTEDLVEAARYLNIMAGTQELDRLLEELRLTSMNMAAGLPPPSNTQYNSKPYYSSQPSRKQMFHDEVYPDNRYTPSRSASVTGYNTDAHNFNDSLHSNYQKHSTFYSDRTENIGKSTSMSKFNSSFTTSPRHQSVFTTTLKQRPPVAPRKFNQIHLTIDPDCGPTDVQSAVSVRLDNNHDSYRREKKLENDLQSAREELANLRRAMSLVDERHQRVENFNDSRNLISPSHSVPRRSPNLETKQFLSTTSSSFQRSYQVQQHSTPGSVSSYQQRTYPRKEPASVYKSQIISNDANFTTPKRTMSHTNVYGPRSWNLRSYQGSESDLAYKREMSSSSRLARSGYSARRERLKQEREQELLRQTRLRQMAASSTGLHDHRQYQQHHVGQQHQQQQHYRSTSAVNEITRKEITRKRSLGNTEAFEEFETITLQPIGRGVQDLDSHVGSMTTLARGGGASSMIEGLSQIDDHQPPRASSRASLSRQPFASTQYLNRQNYNHDGEQTIFINRVQPTSSTPIQNYSTNRLGTRSTYSDQVSVTTTPQTVTGSTKIISNLNVSSATRKENERTEVPIMQNGWKSEKIKLDVVDGDNMAHVNATARVWYRPKLSREEAISILRQQVPGSFLIRDSTTYKDAFGLAVKVATLPPKVTPKSGFTKFVRSIFNDLQSELVRHYLIEAVNTPTKGVRLKGFASEPVFPSLAALINRHTQDALALPCRLILPSIPTTPLPHGYRPPPQIVTGLPSTMTDSPMSNHISQTNTTTTTTNEYIAKIDNATGPVSELGSVIMENNTEIDCAKSMTNTSTIGLVEGLPFECVIKDEHHKPMMPQSLLNQGMTYRCFMLGSVDTPQWNSELCFSKAVDQLIPLETLTASECDHGISRVRYSDIQLHVSAHDGITIIDLLRRLFLRRHLPNNVLLYCGVETRKKEFIHPEHLNHGIRHPKIFGLVVRKGISECTCHIFSECDPVHSAESIVNYIRTIYPHLKS
ncbi:unnamed protein product [Schistosoma turkestanicum]|nr:unnamed protein product [Schistosoma turkestanicum]